MLIAALPSLLKLPRSAPPSRTGMGARTPHACNPYFFILPKAYSIAGVLSMQHQIFLEVGNYKAQNVSLEMILAHAPDFALCLSTASAYHMRSIRPLTDALNARFGLLRPLQDQIETCLHEAISNAVIHGNLGIHSHFKTADELKDHYLLIEERLALPAYKDKRVTICAWNDEDGLTLSVTDQGEGFGMPANEITMDIPHGRGLHLIKSMASHVWIDMQDKTIFMTFNYK